MFGPGKYTEGEVLVGYLGQQLSAIRAAAHGLSDEQARETPCRSALSIGGLVKHATYVLRRRTQQQGNAGAAPDQAAVALFMGSSALRDDETLAGALDDFDEATVAYLADVRATDPGSGMLVPPAPWDGLHTPTDSVQRYALVHHVEEFARHAGHADIIREQLDGATAASLLMAVEGRDGNDFVQPWTPATT
ncbi:DinB family protein [Nocardioides terrisoli]|uniref:DinB family protein n=1 Tax=Nocardioides terrisoli TaxID=3388267 RepID=UPI00287B70A0|nr:DinB family protein [Nocardioides marmorisolisilvae]